VKIPGLQNQNKRDRFNLSVILLFALLIALLYKTSITYAFTGYDDKHFVLLNPYINFTWDNLVHYFLNFNFAMYIPLTFMSYSLDHAIWGFNPIGYHLQNLFWFFIAVSFMYKIMIRIQIDSWIAVLICIFYIVNPQRVESVVWIAERKDVLCSAFYFMSLFVYINNGKHSKKLAFILFIASLLAKPMSITLPFALLAYEFYKTRSFSIKHYLSLFWPFFLIVLAMLPVTYLAQMSLGSIDNYSSFPTKIYSFLYNMLWYAKQTFYPSELCPIYAKISLSMTYIYVIMAYSFILGFLLVTYILNKKLFLYCIAPIIFAYIITLLPVGGIVSIGSIDHADRYSLLPGFYVLIGTAFLLKHLSSNYKNKYILGIKKNFFLFISLLILALLIVFSYIQNTIYQKIWKSDLNLYKYASAFIPANEFALLKLARYEYFLGNYYELYKVTEKMFDTSKMDNIEEPYQINLEFYAAYYRFRASYALKNYKGALLYYDYLNRMVQRSLGDYEYLNFELTAVFCFYHNRQKDKAIQIIKNIIGSQDLTLQKKILLYDLKEALVSNKNNTVCILEEKLNLKDFMKINDNIIHIIRKH